jgi:hypothetical protein
MKNCLKRRARARLNEAPGKLLWEHMLYPQYARDFQPTIPSDVWDAMQVEATRLLLTTSMSSYVEEHVRSIASGVVPFCYAISKKDAR